MVLLNYQQKIKQFINEQLPNMLKHINANNDNNKANIANRKISKRNKNGMDNYKAYRYQRSQKDIKGVKMDEDSLNIKKHNSHTIHNQQQINHKQPHKQQLKQQLQQNQLHQNQLNQNQHTLQISPSKQINLQTYSYYERSLVIACKMDIFQQFLVKLYQYCQEINIIEMRMRVLAAETQSIKSVQPQLLNSEILKVKQKTKEISAIYSQFLIGQPKFKVLSTERSFHQGLIRFIIVVLGRCFKKEEFQRLKREINRLFRTDTFNQGACWQLYRKESLRNSRGSQVKEQPLATPTTSRDLTSKQSEDDNEPPYQSQNNQPYIFRSQPPNYRAYRRRLLSQRSQIRPYVNNLSSFRSKATRSPVITLMFPTHEYLSFDLNSRRKMSQHLEKNSRLNRTAR